MSTFRRKKIIHRQVQGDAVQAQMHKQDLINWRIAYHEAGHAVALNIYNHRIECIESIDLDGHLFRCDHFIEPWIRQQTRADDLNNDTLREKTIISMAGPVAEELFAQRFYEELGLEDLTSYGVDYWNTIALAEASRLVGNTHDFIGFMLNETTNVLTTPKAAEAIHDLAIGLHEHFEYDENMRGNDVHNIIDRVFAVYEAANADKRAEAEAVRQRKLREMLGDEHYNQHVLGRR